MNYIHYICSMKFKIDSEYKPSGDQPSAIKGICSALNQGVDAVTLLGVTGSGKTFTMANVIEKLQRPALILSHNKTLAAQLYGEFKSFFPNNAVEYFVSYYDYYQPEAYLPITDTYIEKDLSINDEIEKLRLSAASALLSGRRDVIVISSVSCLYGIGNPEDFYNEGTRPIEDVRQNYSLLSYFKSISDKPLIIYDCGGIAKDEKVNQAYVIKNGQCRKYYCSATLGELSKMTDEQILEMLEDYYQEGLSEALSTWKSDYNTANAISSGKVKLYEPRAYHIKGCLFTDSTGNSVDGELLFFPQAGVSATPYVIEYPQFSNLEDRFMNYYGTYKDSDSPWDIKFNIEHFNRGNGTQSDINQINDLNYITSSSMITGTV